MSNSDALASLEKESSSGFVGSTGELISKAHSVIDAALAAGARSITPLLSGGHDSMAACIIASKHRAFEGDVFHINTGIGAIATRKYIEDRCAEYGWKLRVFSSNFSYERFVMEKGFPSPGAHQWVYNRLKDRALYGITKGRGKTALVAGCRKHESVRRMGHVESIQIGEKSRRTGTVRNTNRIWANPCWDWTTKTQCDFLDALDVERNPIKMSPLGMSGECFCGAFARPNEIDLIRRYAPDVALEIDRLEALARPRGGRCKWGTRAQKERGIVAAATGPMCSSCDMRSMAAGIVLVERAQQK